VWTEAEEPVADGGVVIDVVAAGVSFADLLQTTGAYQLKVLSPFTPGMDATGVVRSTPPDAGLTAGQRVAVLTSYGCWQEVVRVPAERVLPLPEDMSFEAQLEVIEELHDRENDHWTITFRHIDGTEYRVALSSVAGIPSPASIERRAPKD
jgi:NADPH:quinone reductase-like Zn-dependent oxidoreductase